MKDKEHVIPFLHKLKRPTFVTRDLGFFDASNRNIHYCVVCLAVNQKEAATFVRRFLRHRSFNTKAKRLGKVVHVSHAGIRFWRLGAQEGEFADWGD